MHQANVSFFANRKTQRMLFNYSKIRELSLFKKMNVRQLSTSRETIPSTHASPLFHSSLTDYRQYIESNHEINTLSFLDRPMRSKSIMRFFEKPFQWPNKLSALSFERCQIDDDGLLTLCSYITDAPKSMLLLNLAGNDITTTNIDAFAKAIAQTNIQIIHLEHNQINLLSLKAAMSEHVQQKIILHTTDGKHIYLGNDSQSLEI